MAMIDGGAYYFWIFVIYLGLLIFVNVKSLKQVSTLSDFTTGGHRMGLLIGIGTSLATWVSVASVLGVPGFLYQTGFAAVTGWVAGWFLGTGLLPLIAYKIRRPENPPRTFPEFVHMRYEPFQWKSPLHIIVALLMFLGYFMFSHLQVVGFGIVFSTLTGIRYELAIFGFLFFLIFTNMGGFWSVATTDTLNAIIIMIGVTLGAVTVLNETGGYAQIVQALGTITAPVHEGGVPLKEGILLSPFGTFGFAALLSIFVSNSFGSSVAPLWVARMMAPKNIKAAILQLMWTMVFLIVIFIPLITIGLGAKVLIPSLPVEKTTDYVLPLFIQAYAHPFIGALVLVGILAAAVSTANSMLLLCSTSIYYDIYRVLFPRKEFNELRATRHLRIWTFVLGIITVVSALKPPMLLASGFTYVFGGFGSIFFWVVYLGLYWKRMNRAGAYAGIIVGAAGFIVAEITGFSNSFLLGIGLSLPAVLIAVYSTEPSPLDAYEPYFAEEISDCTRLTMAKIQRRKVTPLVQCKRLSDKKRAKSDEKTE